MNLGVQGTKPFSMPSSSVSRLSGDGVSDQFPAGMRVLVVDDDPCCLMILEKMLRKCLYEVTKCNRAEVALALLRENKNGFDMVISDVHMPDMDGFKLLEHIGLEMDLPVIMMSADDSKSVVMKGVTHGACDYLIKPVRIEELRNVWQHVVRKKKHEWKDFEPSASAEDGERQQKQPEESDYSSSANEGNWRNSKRRKDEEDEGDERDDSSSLKKPRVVWSVELHQQFVTAVNQLSIDKAVPKKILELMNVSGLTRENVASHLQKYRLYLKRLSGQHQNGLNTSFLQASEPAFGSLSTLNALELQALAASGQLPTQSLATFQAAALGRPATKSQVNVPLVDQGNLFSFENPKYRYGEGQQQHLNNNSKHMNLLQGIPTNMEPKQLANLHQSAHSFGGINNQVNPRNGPLLIQMGQTQSRLQMLNENNGNHVSRQTTLPNGVASGILARNGSIDNVREAVYNPVSQAPSLVDFSMNHKAELPGNGFTLGVSAGISSFTSKGVLQDDVNLQMKGPRGVVASYDIFSELNQQKSHDWGSQNVGLTFDVSQHANMQGSLDVNPSALFQHGFSFGQKIEQNRSSSIGNRNGLNIALQHNTHPFDNLSRIKAERIHGGNVQNTLFSEQFGQEDLMSALLKQQQQGSMGPTEDEFGFEGLDNLPT